MASGSGFGASSGAFGGGSGGFGGGGSGFGAFGNSQSPTSSFGKTQPQSGGSLWQMRK